VYSVDIRQVLIWTAAAAEALALGRVCALGLHRRYPFFAACLAISITQTLGLSVFRLNPAGRTYLLLWLVTEPLLVVLEVLVGWELYRRVCDHYRNFQALRGRLLVVSGVMGMSLCALSVYLDTPHLIGQSLAVYEVFTARCATFLLASFLGAAALFFTHFRVPMRRNVLVHGWLLALYYVSTAVYAIAFQAHANEYACDCLFMGIQTLIFVGWATLLSRRGETVEVWPEVSAAEYEATTAAKEQLLRIARDL
jgi:hypothetical protein